MISCLDTENKRKWIENDIIFILFYINLMDMKKIRFKKMTRNPITIQK